MSWRKVFWLWLMLGTAAHGQTSIPNPSGLPSRSVPAPNAGTYTAATASPGAAVPANFVGFSYEVGSPGLLSDWFTGSATSLAGLVGLIGGSNCALRFGGASSDLVTPPNLTSGIVTDLANFLGLLPGSGAGCQIIYGLSITSNDSTTANSQATMLYSALGSKLVIQMGNEPGQGGVPNYSIPTYESRWNAYYAVINAANPGLKYAAIDGGDFIDMPTIVGTLTPGTSGMTLLTQHWYSFNNPFGYSMPLSNFFFSPPSDSSFLGTPCVTITCLWSLYPVYGTKRRVSEAGMISGGGIAGYSNALISATWFLQLSFQLARAGWQGYNVHGDNGGSQYSPLVQNGSNWSPRPVFYGMYLFSQLQGKQVLPMTITGTAPNSDAFAVLDSGGNATMIIVNYDPVNTLTATPNQDKAWSVGTSLLLSGVSCTDTAPTLGGQPIGNGGAWSGSAVPITKGQAISVPPCGATEVRMQP